MSVFNSEISGVWTYTPQKFSDNRGDFFEWFQSQTAIENNREEFILAQANCSISRKNVLRGLHFASYPPGQAKYVSCTTGSIFDVFVDVRLGSPTFGKWGSVTLDSSNPKMLYLPSGIAHGFMSLEDNSTVIYLCDQKYNSLNEHDINAFDEDLRITWPTADLYVQSEKDLNAMSFKEAQKFMPKYIDF